MSTAVGQRKPEKLEKGKGNDQDLSRKRRKRTFELLSLDIFVKSNVT